MTIDDYINKFSPEVQMILQGIRETIHTAVPEATETIRYDMPTFELDGQYLVYFAAWKEHIGLYPLYGDSGELKDILEPFHTEKDSIHIPFTEPFPYEVIKQFARYRVQQEADKREG